MIPRKIVMVFAGLAGITVVAFGALGAHILRGIIAAHNSQELWQVAVEYHFAHTVAILALIGWRNGVADQQPHYVAWISICWMTGILLFSGSLYTLALGGPPAVGPLTPIGGMLLLTGWLIVLVAGWRYRPQSPSTGN